MAERVVTLTPDEEAALRKVVGPVPGAAHLFRDVVVQAPRDPRVAAIQTRPPEVRFLTTEIPPPTAFYLAREDQLRISLWNSVTGVTIFMGARFLGPDGTLVPWVESFTPAATRAESATVLPPVEGYLLGLYFGTTSALLPGQCYISCVVTRPRLAAGSHMHPLAAGYVTISARPGWPAQPLRDARDGQGAIRIITGTTPAVGAESTETVPTGARWRLISWTSTLTTSAQGGNRGAELVADDGTNDLWGSDDPSSIGVSTAQTFFFVHGLGSRVSSGVPGVRPYNPLPTQALLSGGSRIKTRTASLQTGDSWAAPRYVVEEWINV